MDMKNGDMEKYIALLQSSRDGNVKSLRFMQIKIWTISANFSPFSTLVLVLFEIQIYFAFVWRHFRRFRFCGLKRRLYILQI